ncbi:hypothetical protein HK405_001250 [Cladochytrium tenue]|nr:hypothetical protein HK405_001250 [Cladochytrium tenue]
MEGSSVHWTNPNSAWLNLRGSWVTNVCVLVLLRVGLAIVPGISSEAAWTLTNLIYNLATYIMFHGVIGTPYEVNQGEFEALTLWEQIDGGAQFTPTKKYLTAVPIILTHFTHYDFATFLLNLASCLLVTIAKLPLMHEVRLFGINEKKYLE